MAMWAYGLELRSAALMIILDGMFMFLLGAGAVVYIAIGLLLGLMSEVGRMPGWYTAATIVAWPLTLGCTLIVDWWSNR